MTLIIGIHGKMGCGKDYITHHYIYRILNELKLKYIQLSFADQLKINVMTKHTIPFEQLFIQKTQHSRQLLQKEGTEIARNQISEDIWINYHNNWTELFFSRGIDVIITPDVRFQNEYNYIRSKNGIIIKIIAPQRNHHRLLQESNHDMIIYDKLKNHPSECNLDNIIDQQFDLVINNDSYDNTADITHALEKLILKYI